MTRKQRLMATLRGEPVDRPAVCFYELNGIDQDPSNADPFNIYSHASWQPLLELTRQKSDCIALRGIPFKNMPADPVEAATAWETFYRDGSRFMRRAIKAGNRTLTSLSRRDLDVNTVWTLEHLLKDADDVRAWLDMPAQQFGGEPDISRALDAEKRLGDAGIMAVDMADPLCLAADLFSMADYTVIALTEQELFHALLARFASVIHKQAEAVAAALPGRLWRIVGSEYASPPYLPPSLYKEYLVEYDKPMVASVKKYGGYPRIHSHGRLKDILDHIVSTGCVGIDPIEPPPQGDVELSYVRRTYGDKLILFGNIEVSDIENMPTPEFEKKVCRSIADGTEGEGRGFVLMPSACPYGRVLPELTLRNYRKIIEIVETL